LWLNLILPSVKLPTQTKGTFLDSLTRLCWRSAFAMFLGLLSDGYAKFILCLTYAFCSAIILKIRFDCVVAWI
jgi:hypothetical protein